LQEDAEQELHPPPPEDPLNDPGFPAVRVPKRENFFDTSSVPHCGQVIFFFSVEDRKRTSKTRSHG
jgi:hypothetical protein